MLFHASPGNSVNLEPLALLLGRERPVIAFDTPGNGESAPVPGYPTMVEIAAPVGEALDALGVGEFDVFGALTGALVALEVARQHPDRVRHAIFDGLPTYAPEEAEEQLAHHAPAMPLSSDGMHLVWAWNIIRDRALWAPWHDRTAEGASRPRVRAPFPSIETLHERVVEFLKGARTYDKNYAAVFRYPALDRLRELAAPITLTVGQDSTMRSKVMAVADLVPQATVRLLPGLGLRPNDEAAAMFREALDG